MEDIRLGADVYGPSTWRGDERRRRAPRKLPARARRTVRALAEAVAPSREPLPFDVGARAVRFIEAYVPYLPPLFGRGLPWLLVALEWGTLLLGPRRRPLSRLDVGARRAYLGRLLEARATFLRDPVRLLRGLVAIGIYTQPEAEARLGYRPQPFVTEKVRERFERHGKGVAHLA